MNLMLNLSSEVEGELKRFLTSFYQKETSIGNEIKWWVCTYNEPTYAVDIISALLDNKEKYNISISIKVDQGNILCVTDKNYDEIIKALFFLYY